MCILYCTQAITVEQLRKDYEVLTGDMLLAAAFVSYAGPFTSKFRAGLIDDWIKFLKERQLPMTEGITDPLKVTHTFTYGFSFCSKCWLGCISDVYHAPSFRCWLMMPLWLVGCVRACPLTLHPSRTVLS